MANFYGWLVNKLRFKRLGVNPNMKLMAFGAIYATTYSNWKHDPRPLIFIQWCDQNITHGINVHYLSRPDKQWLAQAIYLIKRGKQNIDPKTFYHFLKQQRPNIITTAYRIYHTNMLNAKLASAGITPLDSMIYTTSMDPWINALNDMIRPGEMKGGPTKVSVDPTELQNRIILARNAVDIKTQKVATGPKAPYANPSPFARK
jgi:hypothetical protein